MQFHEINKKNRFSERAVTFGKFRPLPTHQNLPKNSQQSAGFAVNADLPTSAESATASGSRAPSNSG